MANMWRKIKRFATSSDMPMFLVFVLFSTLLWLSRSQGTQHQRTLNLEVRYIGLTPDIQTADSLPHTFKITYTDENYSLFYRKPDIKTINIDLTQQLDSKTHTINLTSGRIQKLIKDELPPSVTILRVEPSSIQTDFEILCNKTVPVKFNGTIKPAPQYQLTDDISIEPSHVTIYGKCKELENIKVVYTSEKNINNVTENYSGEIALSPISGLRFSHSSIQLQAHAQAYTEKNIKLPIQIIGAPEGVKIKTFPAEVNVKLQLGIESYKHFSTSEVKAFVNYNDMLTSTNGIVKVYVSSETIHVFDMKINPENVEFIIEL